MADKMRKFDAEFREGAVRIVAETGEPAAEIARELGIGAILRTHGAVKLVALAGNTVVGVHMVGHPRAGNPLIMCN
ncbi:transposase [Streptomyces sp. NPDC005055]